MSKPFCMMQELVITVPLKFFLTTLPLLAFLTKTTSISFLRRGRIFLYASQLIDMQKESASLKWLWLYSAHKQRFRSMVIWELCSPLALEARILPGALISHTNGRTWPAFNETQPPPPHFMATCKIRRYECAVVNSFGSENIRESIQT